MRMTKAGGRPPQGVVRLLFYTSLLLIAVRCRAQSTAVELERLLPAEIESVVRVASIPALIHHVQASPLGRFYGDAANARLLAPVRESLESGGEEISELLTGKGGDALGYLPGGAVLARYEPAARPGAKGGDGKTEVLIIEHSDEVRARARFGGTSIRRGVHVQKSKGVAHGMEFERIARFREAGSVPKSGLKNIPGARDAGMKRLGDEFIYADARLLVRARGREEVFTEVLRRIKSGRLPSLADSERRRNASSVWSAPPDIEIYHDLAGRAERGRPLVDPDLLGRGGDAAALGADDVKCVAVGFWILPSRIRFEASVYIPASRRGIGGLFFMTEPLHEAAGEAPLIPPDALGYATAGVDLGRYWSAMRRIFQRGAPGILQLVDSYLGALSEGLDERLTEDLLKHLGNRWTVFTRKSKDARRRDPDSTYVFQVCDPGRLRPLLERWLGRTAATMNYQFDTSEVKGRHFYRLRGAEDSAGAAVNVEQVAKACLAGDLLYFSPRFEHIEASLAALDGGGGGGRDRPREDALAELPVNRSIELFSAPKSFRQLSKDPFLSMFTKVFGGLSESVVAMDSAPGDDAWGKWFASAAGAMTTDQEHVLLRLDLNYAKGIMEAR